MSDAVPNSETHNYLVGPPRKALAVKYNWMPNSALWQRHEKDYKLVQSFNSTEQFFNIFDYLRNSDGELYREYGGEILDRVLTKTEEKYSVSFDQRYLRLIQLFTNFDLAAANDFHLRVATIFQLSTNSLVRYERILSSTKNAIGILSTYEHQHLTTDKEIITFSILPMLRGWGVKIYTEVQKSAFINTSQENSVLFGKIALGSAIERNIKPLTMLGDCMLRNLNG